MQNQRYLMRDFNRNKVDAIMQFNVATHSEEPRSILELVLFLAALTAYLCVLALSA